jgi:hypothetical protein
MKPVFVTAFVLLACLVPSAAAAPSSVLVTFEQTGGFAGIERGMSVTRSGKVVSDGLPVTTSQLSAARLALLKQRLVDAHWATLRAKYEPEAPISDGFVYKVTYAGRTIRVDEGATLPLRLKRPYAQLQRIAGISS